MKAPNKELREWVYNKLFNHISATGVTGYVPICSIPKKDQSFPFVDLGNIALLDLSTKTEYITNATFELNVYTQFADENTSYTICENISSAILELLVDVRGTTTSFTIVAARFVNSTETFEQSETVKAISNQINIEFTIEQL